ncbi:mannose-P-dolichol utilization defect 1 protein [Phlegmacium glaucopus]|nr:mannose-P-dolichol utilization defect 1 protein [Phlegmacium glaucopus]
MSVITRNLPWFIKDLGVSIIGEECYTSLIENLDVSDGKCLRYSLSKILGVGIVIGGSIMKIPQIILIVNARSAHGLSLSAYILETLSYAITLAYSFRHQFPFSTYGENLFLTLQNVLITLLIIIYSPSTPMTRKRSPKSQSLIITSLSTLVTGVVLYTIPLPTLALLQITTLPLSLFSKIPQIRQNLRSKSTGQLSTFAVISQIAGCLARLFTTATEVGDSLVSAGFALALLLNIILGIQLWVYWGNGEDLNLSERYKFKEKANPHLLGVDNTSQWREPIESLNATSHRLSTPPPQISPLGVGRKWARKVD